MRPNSVSWRNLGVWQGIVRIALGLLMLALGWWGDFGRWGPVLRVFAFYPVVTGLLRWDPVFTLLRSRHPK